MFDHSADVSFFCEAGEFHPHRYCERDALADEAARVCRPQRVWSIFNANYEANSGKKPDDDKVFWKGDVFTVCTSTPDRVRFKHFLKVSRHVDFTVDHPTDIRVLVLFAKSTSARRFTR